MIATTGLLPRSHDDINLVGLEASSISVSSDDSTSTVRRVRNPFINVLFSHMKNARLTIPAVSSGPTSFHSGFNKWRFSDTSARNNNAFTTKQSSKTHDTAKLFKNINAVRTRAMSKRHVMPKYKHSKVDGRTDRLCSTYDTTANRT